MPKITYGLFPSTAYFLPDAAHPLRADDTTSFTFHSMALGGDYWVTYSCEYKAACYFNKVVDTTSTKIWGSGKLIYHDFGDPAYFVYAKVFPHAVGSYSIYFYAQPQNRDPNISIQGVAMEFAAVDTPKGKYINVPTVAFRDTIKKGNTITKNIRIENPWISTDKLHARINHLDSAIFHFDNNIDSFALEPGQAVSLSFTISGNSEGLISDTAFVYSDATQSPDTIAIPISTMVLSNASVETSSKKPISLSVAVFPNPARDDISFAIESSEAGTASITVVDFLGRTCATLINTIAANGTHILELNTNNLQTGIYSYTADFNGRKQTGRVCIVK
ncbi:MAG TPA: T9SS type A sorting domain-containing protein [Candidatus Kapabacteria bacterium]|nr:T9SS type A sorting domain-containing protein [Candidatus Kapabacteria bacterium]